jgi:hypothetical protein
MPESLRASGGIEVYRAKDLKSYRTDFNDDEFEAEKARVITATDIERQWTKGLVPYQTDQEILEAVHNRLLQKMLPRPGLMPIQRLIDWDEQRSYPSHKYYYSPPYLRHDAAEVLEFIAAAWNILQRQRGEPYIFLAATSMVRSRAYQKNLLKRDSRKIAIDTTNGYSSSHEFGLAFDIDASGIYRFYPDKPVKEAVVAINPRNPDVFNAQAELIAEVRLDLTGILQWLGEREIINTVEEVPRTQEWCFHVCVNPRADRSDILKL